MFKMAFFCQTSPFWDPLASGPLYVDIEENQNNDIVIDIDGGQLSFVHIDIDPWKS